MRRSLFALVVALFVLVGLAVPASAQYGRDPLSQVMGDNMRMVRNAQCGGCYGYWGGGVFTAMYDPYGRPLPRPVRIAMTTATGAMIGYGMGGKRGAAIGGGIGLGAEVVANIFSRRRNKKSEEMMPPQQGGVVYDRNGRPVGLAEQAPEMEWQLLRNEFDGVTVVARVTGYDPNKPIVIPPGQTVSVQVPKGSQIWAEAQVCLDDKCSGQRWRQDVGRRPLPQGAGWVFFNPSQGGR